MKTTLAQRAYIVASVISRRWYGVKLEKSGGKFPQLIQLGYAVVRALAAAKEAP